MKTEHFCLWLSAQFHRDDDIGAIARLYVADRNAPKVRNAQQLIDWMVDAEYDEEVVAAMEKAANEFNNQLVMS